MSRSRLLERLLREQALPAPPLQNDLAHFVMLQLTGELDTFLQALPPSAEHGFAGAEAVIAAKLGELTTPKLYAKIVRETIEAQFGDPHAAVRELGQNAIDAYGPEHFGRAVRFDVAHDAQSGLSLRVSDDGVGMSLGTVIRDLLIPYNSGKETDATKIGEHGIGWFSVADVSDIVQVRTQRADAPHAVDVLLYRSSGIWKTSVQPFAEAQPTPGTSVTAYIRKEVKMRPSSIQEHARHYLGRVDPVYADIQFNGASINTLREEYLPFASVPLHLDGRSEPLLFTARKRIAGEPYGGIHITQRGLFIQTLRAPDAREHFAEHHIKWVELHDAQYDFWLELPPHVMLTKGRNGIVARHREAIFKQLPTAFERLVTRSLIEQRHYASARESAQFLTSLFCPSTRSVHISGASSRLSAGLHGLPEEDVSVVARPLRETVAIFSDLPQKREEKRQRMLGQVVRRTLQELCQTEYQADLAQVPIIPIHITPPLTAESQISRQEHVSVARLVRELLAGNVALDSNPSNAAAGFISVPFLSVHADAYLRRLSLERAKDIRGIRNVKVTGDYVRAAGVLAKKLVWNAGAVLYYGSTVGFFVELAGHDVKDWWNRRKLAPAQRGSTLELLASNVRESYVRTDVIPFLAKTPHYAKNAAILAGGIALAGGAAVVASIGGMLYASGRIVSTAARTAGRAAYFTGGYVAEHFVNGARFTRRLGRSAMDTTYGQLTELPRYGRALLSAGRKGWRALREMDFSSLQERLSDWREDRAQAKAAKQTAAATAERPSRWYRTPVQSSVRFVRHVSRELVGAVQQWIEAYRAERAVNLDALLGTASTSSLPLAEFLLTVERTQVGVGYAQYFSLASHLYQQNASVLGLPRVGFSIKAGYQGHRMDLTDEERPSMSFSLDPEVTRRVKILQGGLASGSVDEAVKYVSASILDDCAHLAGHLKSFSAQSLGAADSAHSDSAHPALFYEEKAKAVEGLVASWVSRQANPLLQWRHVVQPVSAVVAEYYAVDSYTLRQTLQIKKRHQKHAVAAIQLQAELRAREDDRRRQDKWWNDRYKSSYGSSNWFTR